MSSSQFTPETYPLGQVETYHSAEAVFQRLPGGKKIRHIEPGCGCTNFNYTDEQIRVTYTAGGIPDGVKELGHTRYEVAKYLTVEFEDDSYQQLWITANIFEPTPEVVN